MIPDNLMAQLPPFLRISQTMEPEDLPLQVLLLTMELARQRETIDRLLTALSPEPAHASDGQQPAP